MLVQPMSDLHIEFYRSPGREAFNEIDVVAPTLISAGDLNICYQLGAPVREILKKWERLILVAGNHEHYHASKEAVAEKFAWLKNKYGDRIYPLQNDSVTIEGTTFHGTTLWFPPSYQATLPVNQRGMSDFHVIERFSSWVFDANKEAVEFLKQNVSPGDVVITHHAPSEQSVMPWYKFSEMNAFYFTPLEGVIRELKPNVWIHGHMHDHTEYEIHDTLVVCNPRGYKHCIDERFRNDMILEV